MKLQSQSFKSFSEELQEIRKNESKEKNKLKAEKRVRKHEKKNNPY